ncbi:MAG: cadmium-translocating P-type ATPase [Candidatus Izimaplasma sp.]|nr:cadmium-translocating P-type ATPase [Candidatus Izimaplasma bacterium]
MIKKVIMKNLICSNCAGKIERELSELDYINSASFNFPNQVMLIDATDEYDEGTAIPEIKRIVDSIEEGVETYPYDKRHLIQTKKSIETYYTFFIGIVLFAIGMYINYVFNGTALDFDHNVLAAEILFWISYLLVAYKLIKKTIKGLKRKDFFNENTLMLIATFAASFLGEHLEAVLVVIFYTIGEYLQHKAVEKSKQEVSGLMDLRVEYANVLENGKVVIKDPHSIKKGDTIVIKNGEKVPVDGTIIKGTTSLNTSALTGESKLSTVKLGDYILSGNINVGNVIHLKASKEYSESTIAKMIDLIENSTHHKAKAENFITKFARYYTPLVTLLAFLMFLIPSIFDWANYQTYIYRAAIFLVISCPCALVLSVPLSYFAGIGAAAKRRILFKGSSFLHMMTNVDTIALDKTGTLTHGEFTVSDYTNKKALKIAASVENFSTHPIAKSIVSFYDGEFIDYKNVEEIAGYGLVVDTVKGKILVGNRKLLNKHNIKFKDKKVMSGSNVYVSEYGKYIGKIVVKDQIKNSAYNTIWRLSKKYKMTMLTGDNSVIASEVANNLGGINFESSLLPEEKIEKFAGLKTKKYKMFIGDGINDAPLLKNADIGVAMGNGSELAIDVADVIIMDEDINLLEKAFKIARKTKIIVYENIIFSLAVKFLFLGLAGFGETNMLMAIFADVGITLIAVLNSLRLIFRKG